MRALAPLNSHAEKTWPPHSCEIEVISGQIATLAYGFPRHQILGATGRSGGLHQIRSFVLGSNLSRLLDYLFLVFEGKRHMAAVGEVNNQIVVTSHNTWE